MRRGQCGSSGGAGRSCSGSSSSARASRSSGRTPLESGGRCNARVRTSPSSRLARRVEAPGGQRWRRPPCRPSSTSRRRERCVARTREAGCADPFSPYPTRTPTRHCPPSARVGRLAGAGRLSRDVYLRASDDRSFRCCSSSRSIEIPAVVYLGFWFLMQVLSGFLALSSTAIRGVWRGGRTSADSWSGWRWRRCSAAAGATRGSGGTSYCAVNATALPQRSTIDEHRRNPLDVLHVLGAAARRPSKDARGQPAAGAEPVRAGAEVRVIALIHRQETMSFLGFPHALHRREDSEEVLRAIRLTDATADRPDHPHAGRAGAGRRADRPRAPAHRRRSRCLCRTTR